MLRAALERASLATAPGSSRARLAPETPAADRSLRARPLENALLDLLRAAGDESDAFFAELASEWMFEKSAELFRRIAELCESLRRLGPGAGDRAEVSPARSAAAREGRLNPSRSSRAICPAEWCANACARATGPRGARWTRR